MPESRRTGPAALNNDSRGATRTARDTPAPFCTVARDERPTLAHAPVLPRPARRRPLRAAPIQHDLLIIDEGLGQLLRINETDPAKNWIVPTGHPQARDLRLVGGGRVLVGHDAGYTEFDIATGRVAKDAATFKGASSVKPPRAPG